MTRQEAVRALLRLRDELPGQRASIDELIAWVAGDDAPAPALVTPVVDDDPRNQHEPYQPPEDSAFRRPTASQVGATWLSHVTGVDWPVAAWRRELEAIGLKPPSSKHAVAKALKADEWVRANPHLVNPGHVAKHWPRYASGRETVDVGRDHADLAAERRLAARKAEDAATHAKMQRDLRGEYSPPPASVGELLGGIAPREASE